MLDCLSFAENAPRAISESLRGLLEPSRHPAGQSDEGIDKQPDHNERGDGVDEVFEIHVVPMVSIVADGNDVRSKTARCTIMSRKETGDTIDFQGACASEIMATSTNLRLKILNANSVSRIFTDPAFAGMELTFYRCSM